MAGATITHGEGYDDSESKLRDDHDDHDDHDEAKVVERTPSILDQDIHWHYLTFETELPSPNYFIQSPRESHKPQPPPECPDLKNYTSPFLWSSKRKSFITIISCVTTLISAYSSGAYASGVDQMSREWHVSKVAILVGITTYTTGFALAPMFLAPFSEINGRRPIFIITGWLFVAMQLACALTPTYAGILIARFLVGCFASTFSTMVGGVVSDIYQAKDRNTALALFAGSALFGSGLGPLVSGFIAQNITWRWIFYHQVILCGVILVFVTAFFKETRGSILLIRKAKALNSWYDELERAGHYGMILPSAVSDSKDSHSFVGEKPTRIRWKVKAEEERASIPTMIYISLHRPLHLLIHEPTVFFFSLWISFSWGILYLTFSAVPFIFRTLYGFDIAQSDAIFASISVASCISTIVAVFQDKFAQKILPNKYQSFLREPEGRLLASCVQSSLLPIGLFWLGWTSFKSIPWIVPAIAVGCATMGVFSIYLATFQYFADIYGPYTSSSLAAQSFCRNLLAGAFPLFAEPMFSGLTFQGAGSLLGGIATLLSIVPWVLVIFGPKIRARSKFAQTLIDERG